MASASEMETAELSSQTQRCTRVQATSSWAASVEDAARHLQAKDRLPPHQHADGHHWPGLEQGDKQFLEHMEHCNCFFGRCQDQSKQEIPTSAGIRMALRTGSSGIEEQAGRPVWRLPCVNLGHVAVGDAVHRVNERPT